MGTAKVLYTISRLLGIAGEANDAGSAYTHVPMNESPILLKHAETEWTVNMLARAVARWTNARDKKKAQCISNIWFTTYQCLL